MKAGHQSGYTVLEVMIFLAITSLIFISAIVAIGGRQESTQYTQGIKELDLTIQTVINDVATGYFPQSNLSCSVGGGQLSFPTGGEQGTSRDCMFLGKAIHFAPSGTGNTGLTIYTLAGRRMQPAPNHREGVTNLRQATPTVVDSFTEQSSTTYGLRITRVVRRNGSLAQQTPFLAFVSSLGRINPADKSLASSAKTVRLAAISGGTSVGVAESSVKSTLGTLSDTTPNHVDMARNGLVVCVESANRRFAGAIGVGVDGGGLVTTIDQDIKGSMRYPECA